MGQVPTVGQLHCKDAVTRFEDRKVDRQIGRCTTVGLHVDVLCAIQLFPTGYGQALEVIGTAAAGMKPPSRIAFGGLQVESRSLGFQD